MASLYFAAGARAGERISLDREKITFGRHSSCDCVLKDKTVSRKHFYVERIGKKYFLVDQGSNNGTFANGERVSWVELRDGDRIQAGSFTLIAELPVSQRPQGPEPSQMRDQIMTNNPGDDGASPFDAEHMRAYPPEYLDGIRLFNAQRYFDAHEAWEEIWLRSSGDDKLFYQMLIQSAVGLHHYERGNSRGGRGMHKAVIEKLSRLPAVYKSLDLVEFSRLFKGFFADLTENDNENAPPPDRARPGIRLLKGSLES